MKSDLIERGQDLEVLEGEIHILLQGIVRVTVQHGQNSGVQVHIGQENGLRARGRSGIRVLNDHIEVCVHAGALPLRQLLPEHGRKVVDMDY